ncbi:MAG: AAA family ATPase [Vampirovibrionales bacterium]|jgi:AAA15 family ATPase/GTPase|nr:AAA family ATPase [Vampirovibrionales bacterium]
MSEPIYESIHIKNFGPLKDLKWDNLGGINLIVGENGSGKTFLLKALYATIKAIEEMRGEEIKPFIPLLLEKLYWTFEAKAKELVTQKQSEPLFFEASIQGSKVSYEIDSKDGGLTEKKKARTKRPENNSIFLPTKEVISLMDIIRNARFEKVFGFDATYSDLREALAIPPKVGKNHAERSKARKKVEDIIGGRVYFDEKKEKWFFKPNAKLENTHSIRLTSEGTKKLGVLDTLLGNRYLLKGSVIFIDEPESALHPKAVDQFMEVLFHLAQDGMQIFIASHSYFVIEKLHLIALGKNESGNKMSIPVLLHEKVQGKSQWRSEDLKEGMPKNSIIEESIALFNEEMRP